MPSLPIVEQLEHIQETRADRDKNGGLAAGTMGGIELMAQSTAGIAPSAVMVSGATLVAGSAGPGTLYSYAVSLVVLLLVGWCVSKMSKLRPGEDLLSHITEAFGRGVGFVGSMGLAFGYLLIAIGSLAQVSLYTKPVFGISTPTSAGAQGTNIHYTLMIEIACMLGAGFMMVRGVRVSAWAGVILEVLSIGTILVVLVMALAHTGFSMAPLMVTDISASQVVSGMVLAILGFVGFESAACLSVEAKDPQRTIPRAVTGSALLAGSLYLFSCYSQMVSFGSAEKLADDATPMNTLADGVGHHWLAIIIDIGAVASNFACITGSLTAASRVLHSMAESRLVHSKMGVSHPVRKTPHVAILVLSIVTFVVAATLGLGKVNEEDLYSWAGGLGTYGYMLAYILIGIGLPILIRKLAPWTPKLNLVSSGMLGGVVALSLGYVFYRNVYPAPPWPINLMFWIFIGVLALSALWYATGPGRKTPSDDDDHKLVTTGS